MATGRVDVLRRSDSYNYSKREFEYYRNGVSRGDVGHGRSDELKHRNGFHQSSNVRYSRGYGRLPNAPEPLVKNGKTRRSEDAAQLPAEKKEFGDDVKHRNGLHRSSKMCDSRGSGPRLPNAPELVVKNCKTRRSEDAYQSPPEKKRKFSPIIWDKEEKEVRVSSKNRVVPVIPLPSPHPDVARLPAIAKVEDVVSVGVLSKSPARVVESLEAEVSEISDVSQFEAPADLSAPLHPQKVGEDEQVQKNKEDKEFFYQRDISLSKWSSDSDSPRDISDDSSPESGEIRIESSRLSRARTSGSDKEDSFEKPGSGDTLYGDELCDDALMDADNYGGNAEDSRFYSDSEDDSDLSQIEEPEVPTQKSINMLQGCRSVFEYERLNHISEGTYGVVFRARDKKTGEIVALKKMKMDVDKGCDGFPMSALREINILLSFNHPSIVGVKEVVMDDFDGVYMVMEHMDHDLKGLMESMKQPFSIGEVKYLMKQLLEGVEYLHDNWILHRDLKTSNILLNNEGELKICDFGLSRQYGSPLKPYTSLVVTLWYRAPEILLGTKQYSTAIDMWSVGCIMAELLAKAPLFSGKDEIEQLDKIFKTLGTPDEKSGLSKLPGFKANFVKQPYNLLRKKFPAASFTGSCPVLSESGFDLLKRLLCYNPAERITAKDALNHNWFRESPEPRRDFKPITPDRHVQDRHLNSRRREKILQQ
ncbi:cyclin-dependent kinase G-2-like [Pyrus communis]|uniref:cyclin-dependent kinase G-2-like n=1 Tax=Pyrus communis TaxID=23211 RepID=UPI0035BF386F